MKKPFSSLLSHHKKVVQKMKYYVKMFEEINHKSYTQRTKKHIIKNTKKQINHQQNLYT